MADDKEMKRRIDAEMNRCIHFTGIGNSECKAGVNYRNLIGGPDFGWAKHLPCLKDDQSPVVCTVAKFPTEDEARTEVDRREVAIQRFLSELNDGVCPYCKIQVQQRQVGSCVYGTCGHRLYQGKVNSRFAEKKIHSVR